MIVSFAGHSRIAFTDRLKQAVKSELRKLLSEGGSLVCYLGGYGDFDALCASACRELKREGGAAELVYVSPYRTLSEQARISDRLRLGLYDSSLYPPIENVPPKFAILNRNEWMMSSADVILTYVKHTYGGAYRSLQAAKAKGKRIIDMSRDFP